MQVALVFREDGCAEVNRLAIDLHAGKIKRVIAQLEGLSTPGCIDMVCVALQADGGLAGYLAFGAPQECQTQDFGIDRAHAFDASGITIKRSLLGFAVDTRMVDALQPSPERLVQGGQIGDMRCRHLRVEGLLGLIPELLDLAFALRMVGCCENDLGAQCGTSGAKLGGVEDLTVVDTAWSPLG